jgi:hypothetical protein
LDRDDHIMRVSPDEAVGGQLRPDNRRIGALYRLELKIPFLPPMNTAATRRHHLAAGKAAKKMRMLVVGMVGRDKPEKPLACARIRCERHSGSRQPDDENLRMSFKAVIDALTKSRWKKDKRAPGGRYWIQRADVLEDDGPEFLEREYAWFPAPRKQGFVRIVVEDIGE